MPSHLAPKPQSCSSWWGSHAAKGWASAVTVKCQAIRGGQGTPAGHPESHRVLLTALQGSGLPWESRTSLAGGQQTQFVISCSEMRARSTCWGRKKCCDPAAPTEHLYHSIKHVRAALSSQGCSSFPADTVSSHTPPGQHRDLPEQLPPLLGVISFSSGSKLTTCIGTLGLSPRVSMENSGEDRKVLSVIMENLEPFTTAKNSLITHISQASLQTQKLYTMPSNAQRRMCAAEEGWPQRRLHGLTSPSRCGRVCRWVCCPSAAPPCPTHSSHTPSSAYGQRSAGRAGLRALQGQHSPQLSVH